MSDHACTGHCETCAHRAEEEQQNCKLRLTLGKIKHKIIVMSGKGGVGKSTVAVNLACALAEAGRKVGLLDVDVHGPSVPKMLHLEHAHPEMLNDKLLPVTFGNLKVLSVGFMLENDDDAVIWRGPMKIGVIKQFIEDCEWGELDDLVIDCPPGTGDEPLAAVQLIQEEPQANVGAVIVTTPQQVSATDVSKSINFCSQLKLKIFGIVENLSGFVCPHCNTVTEIFASGAGEALAQRYKIPFAGKLPIDPAVCQGGDAGKPFASRQTSGAAHDAFAHVYNNLVREIDRA